VRTFRAATGRREAPSERFHICRAEPSDPSPAVLPNPPMTGFSGSLFCIRSSEHTTGMQSSCESHVEFPLSSRNPSAEAEARHCEEVEHAQRSRRTSRAKVPDLTGLFRRAMHVVTRNGQRHAARNQVPPPSHPSHDWLALRRLGRDLAWRLDARPPVLRRDGGEIRTPSRDRARQTNPHFAPEVNSGPRHWAHGLRRVCLRWSR
jgi:hypothetical protein